MQVFTVTKNEAEVLEDFFSPESRKNIGEEGFYTIGALDDDGFVAGVLQFFLDFARDEGFWARLDYIFVPEDFRESGVGAALMDEFYSIIRSGRVDRGYLELPKDRDDELGGFFTRFGFLFDGGEFAEYNLPLSAFSENKALEKVPVDGCRSISYLEDEDFLGILRQTHSDIIVNAKDGFDQEASSYYDEGGDQGLFLVRQNGSYGLEASFLGGSSDKPQKKLLSLVAYGVRKAGQLYEPDTTVRVVCRSRFAKELMTRLCPDAEPTKVLTALMDVR